MMAAVALGCALLALAVVNGLAVYACRAATAWNREVDELTRQVAFWKCRARDWWAVRQQASHDEDGHA